MMEFKSKHIYYQDLLLFFLVKEDMLGLMVSVAERLIKLTDKLNTVQEEYQ